MGGDEGRTILVSGIPTDFHLETIRSYFGNKDKSNGGPIEGNLKWIESSGQVIITFELAKDAENVVQKKDHYIYKYELRVKWYEDPVWQKDAMIVSNGHKDISEEMLIDFLEKNGELDIVYVSPGRKSGTFLVYCQNEIDFEYVQKMCQKEPLEGNQLKVDTIEEINSIQVKTVYSKVSYDSLENYFGDKKRSSGGDISSIKQQINDTYIVSFKEKSVVLDICRKVHLLQDVELDVQPFWEPFEENISRQQIHGCLLPSNFYLTFLKNHKIIVNDKLKKWADVIWQDSKFNKLKLNYTEGNLENVNECLKDLLKSITVEIIDIPTNIFKDIVETFSKDADQRYFYFDNQKHQANILGFNKSNVIKMKNRLLDNLRIKCEDNLNIHERSILSGLSFFEKAERQSEDLKLRIDGDKVNFEGCDSKIATCKRNMHKSLDSIEKSKLCLPLNTGMIMNKKPVKEYLKEKLRKMNCIGSWEKGDNDSVLLYAKDKTHLSLLEEIMKQTFVANTLDFIDKIKGTSNHGKWLTLVQSLQEEFQDSHFIGENSLSFVAVDEVVNDIKSKIDDFVQSLTYESDISMTHAHFLFLKQFNEQQINAYSQKIKIKNVCLKENKLHLEGTQNQIKKMETYIENLRKDISSQEVKFEMFGFQEFLESEEGNNFICEMQTKSESIISLNSDLGSETDEILNFLYKNCEIVLREGDITTLDTDAIVNFANGNLKHMEGIAAAIVQKDGFHIQAESDRIMNQRRSELKTGEIVSTNAGRLKCKTIIHAVGPVWMNGQAHEIFYLSRAVENCLKFLDENFYTSIAIPAISTGIFGIPIEEGTKCTAMTIKNYLDDNITSKIKHICLIDIRKEVIRAFKFHLEAVFGISKSRDDEDEEIEENVFTGQQDDGVTLKFFAKYKNLDHAIETAKEAYLSLLTTEKIPFTIDLTEPRVIRLKNIIRKHKIQMSISDTITIHGRHSHVKDAKLSVQTLLNEFRESDDETFIKEMVQWYYFDENSPENLKMFNDKENAKLQKAFLKKKKCVIWNDTKYNIQKMSFQKAGKIFKMKRKLNQKDELFPDTFSPMGDKELFKIVQVTHGQEYDDIQTTFRQNFPSSYIMKIERIQNKTLYDGYQALKTKFEGDNPNIRNEVDNLWHGTAAESVDGINRSGFNRSYCGKNATALGEGVYFARDIRYSAQDTYSTPAYNRTKRIYKCSVLVGKVMQGHPGLKVLQESYNSAVDNIQNPSIYVIFHHSQAYPNYLITFTN